MCALRDFSSPLVKAYLKKLGSFNIYFRFSIEFTAGITTPVPIGGTLT